MPTFILNLLNGIKPYCELSFHRTDSLRFSGYCQNMVFRWCTLIRNTSITLEASNFSKIPSVNVRYIIVGLYYIKTPPPQGYGNNVGTAHFVFCHLKTAILCHMTSKLLVQTKDDEMYVCIKFCVFIHKCTRYCILEYFRPTFENCP